MKITKEILLEKWSAYLAPLPKGSSKNHRIIIIYKTDINVKYFYITSKTETAKIILRNDPISYVELLNKDWDKLTKEKSCIRCDRGHLKEISIKELQELYDAQLLKYLGKIPKEIQEKIINAVNSSISYSFVEQAIITK